MSYQGVPPAHVGSHKNTTFVTVLAWIIQDLKCFFFFFCRNTTVALGDIQLCVGGVEMLSVLSTRLCINLPYNISLANTVTVYGAVMSPNQLLVKPSDYICNCTGAGEVRYLILHIMYNTWLPQQGYQVPVNENQLNIIKPSQWYLALCTFSDWNHFTCNTLHFL